MSDQRVTVWLLRPKGRTSLMFQWVDPDTHRRKSKMAGTNDPEKAGPKIIRPRWGLEPKAADDSGESSEELLS
jgi:hypothetical protein